MPLIKIQVTTPVPADRQKLLLRSASRILSEATGKPEAYVMVMIEPAAAAMMAGQVRDAAFVDVRGIGGFNPTVNAALSQRLCELLHAELQIDPENVYLNVTDVPAAHWGWKGQTFG